MATEKFVLFTSEFLDDDAEGNQTNALQNRVNSWLAEHPNIEIAQRLFSECNLGWSVAIFYVENPGPKRPSKAAAKPRARGNLKVAK